MDANVNGLRLLLQLQPGAETKGKPVEEPCTIPAARYTVILPDSIPTPESYRGYVSCTGPRCTMSRNGTVKPFALTSLVQHSLLSSGSALQ